MNILGWSDWRILNMSENETVVCIQAEPLMAPSHCLHCQKPALVAPRA